MEWRTVERQGYFGKRRDKFYGEFDEKYGIGNWRIAWQWGEEILPYELACQIYEDSYYEDSFRREDLWMKLTSKARDVYDIGESDIESGLDYLVQKGAANHLQDIAIRRVVMRRRWRFNGEELIQIRSHKNYWGRLSPGRVPFHMPEMISVPHLKGWWDCNSTEDFYQSNKVLQVKE